MRKVILFLVCFCMAFYIFGGEKIRLKLSDGKSKFAEYDGTAVFDRKGRVISSTMGGVNYKWEYDDNGKIITDPDFFATYDSDGKMLSFTDRKTNETFHYEYNENGKKVKTSKDGVGVSILYEYDDNGKLVYEKNILKDCAYIYDYDENGNLICKTDDNNRETIYKYDENNNLIYFRDTDGYEYSYDYDEKGRVVSVWENGSAKIESYKYNDKDVIIYKCYINPYLGSEHRFYYNDDGNIIKEVNFSDVIEYEYDDNNNIIRKRKYNDQGYSINLLFDYVYTYEYYENGEVYKKNRYKLCQ